MADINGIPYVESSDLVSAYPAVSQSLAQEVSDQLASKLDSGAGKILQVVSTAKTDTSSLSTSGRSWTSDILTVSITPSAVSSKILISGFICGAFSDDTYRIIPRLLRGATPVGVGDAASNRIPSTAASWAVVTNSANIATAPFTYIDSPATTSATTYAVQLFNTSTITRTIFVNRSNGDADTASTPRSISTITVMEVSG